MEDYLTYVSSLDKPVVGNVPDRNSILLRYTSSYFDKNKKLIKYSKKGIIDEKTFSIIALTNHSIDWNWHQVNEIEDFISSLFSEVHKDGCIVSSGMGAYKYVDAFLFIPNPQSNDVFFETKPYIVFNNFSKNAYIESPEYVRPYYRYLNKYWDESRSFLFNSFDFVELYF